MSQTLNPVTWRCVWKEAGEWLPDLSWLEGRTRPSECTPGIRAQCCGAPGLQAMQMPVAGVHGRAASRSQGASQENRWGVFLETTVGAKLSVSLLDPRAAAALIPLDVDCHAIIFKKALSTPEENFFPVKSLGSSAVAGWRGTRLGFLYSSFPCLSIMFPPKEEHFPRQRPGLHRP